MFGFGNSEYKQLSTDDDNQQINSPRYLQTLKGLGKIVDIASGGSYCMVLNGNKTNSYSAFFISYFFTQKTVMCSLGASDYSASGQTLSILPNQNYYQQLSSVGMNSIQTVA